MLVHLQTAHGSYEAQKKIESILHYLKSHYGFKTVFVEGSAFKLEPEMLRFFPGDKKLTRQVVNDLAKKAIVKGAGLFLIDEPQAEGYGIEKLETYNANKQVFQSVLGRQQQAEQFIRQMQTQIYRVKASYLGRDLKTFLKRLERYEDEKTPAPEWLRYLKQEAGRVLNVDLNDAAWQIDWPTLVRIFKLEKFETKLDRAAYPDEYKKFLAAARPFFERGKAEIPSDSDYFKIQKLLTMPLAHHRLPAPETLRLFEAMVDTLGPRFDYSAYPNVKCFIGQLLFQSEIFFQGEASDLLMDEIDRLAIQIQEKLTRTDEERKIIALLRQYRLLQKLFALELTPADYEDVLHTASLKPADLSGRFLALSKNKRIRDIQFTGLAEMDFLFKDALEFYRLAKQRDHEMIENVKRRLWETGTDRAVIVTGGFHSGPFRKYFEQHDFSYALVSPKITDGVRPEERQLYIQSILPSPSNLLTKATLESDSPELRFSRRMEAWGKNGARFLAAVELKSILKAVGQDPESVKRFNRSVYASDYGIELYETQNAGGHSKIQVRSVSRSELRLVQRSTTLPQNRPGLTPEIQRYLESPFNRMKRGKIREGQDIGETGDNFAAEFIQDLQEDMKAQKGKVIIHVATGNTPWIGYTKVAEVLKTWNSRETQSWLKKFGLDTGYKPDMKRVVVHPLDALFPQKRTDYHSFANILNHMFERLGIPKENRHLFYGDVKDEYGRPMSDRDYAALLKDIDENGLLIDEYMKVTYGPPASPVILRAKRLLDRHPIQKRFLQAFDAYSQRMAKELLEAGGAHIFISGVGPSHEGRGHIGFMEGGTPFDQGLLMGLVGFHMAGDHMKENGGMATMWSKNHREKFGFITYGFKELLYRPNVKVIGIATGIQKAEAIRRGIETRPNRAYPITRLQQENVTWIVDRFAARGLRYKTNPWDFGLMKWTPPEIANLFITLSRQLKKPMSQISLRDFINTPGKEDPSIWNLRQQNLKKLFKRKNSMNNLEKWHMFRTEVSDQIRKNRILPDQLTKRLGLKPRSKITFMNPHLDDDVLAMYREIKQFVAEGHDVSFWYTAPGYTAVHSDYAYKALEEMAVLPETEIVSLINMGLGKEAVFAAREEELLRELIQELESKIKAPLPKLEDWDYDIWALESDREKKLRAKLLLLRFAHQHHHAKLAEKLKSQNAIKNFIKNLRGYDASRPRWGSEDLSVMKDIKVILRFAEAQSSLMRLGVKHQNIHYPMNASWYGTTRNGTVRKKDIHDVIGALWHDYSDVVVGPNEDFGDGGAHDNTKREIFQALMELRKRGEFLNTKVLGYRGVWDRTPANAGKNQVSVMYDNGDLDEMDKVFENHFRTQSRGRQPVPDSGFKRPMSFSKQVKRNAAITLRENAALADGIPPETRAILNFNYVLDFENAQAAAEINEMLNELDHIREPVDRAKATAIYGPVPFGDASAILAGAKRLGISAQYILNGDAPKSAERQNGKVSYGITTSRRTSSARSELRTVTGRAVKSDINLDRFKIAFRDLTLLNIDLMEATTELKDDRNKALLGIDQIAGQIASLKSSVLEKLGSDRKPGDAQFRQLVLAQVDRALQQIREKRNVIIAGGLIARAAGKIKERYRELLGNKKIRRRYGVVKFHKPDEQGNAVTSSQGVYSMQTVDSNRVPHRESQVRSFKTFWEDFESVDHIMDSEFDHYGAAHRAIVTLTDVERLLGVLKQAKKDGSKITKQNDIKTSMITDLTRAAETMNAQWVIEKEIAQKALWAAVRQVELEDWGPALTMVTHAKGFVEIRFVELRHIIKSLQYGRLREMRYAVNSRNRDYLSALRRMQSELVTKQAGRRNEFSKKANWLRTVLSWSEEPDLEGVLGLVAGAISSAQKEDYSRALSYIEAAKRRVRQSSLLQQFMENYRNEIKNLRLNNPLLSPDVARETAFGSAHQTFIQENGIEANSSKDLWWKMRFYSAVMVPFKIKGAKNGERVVSSAFKAFQTLLLILNINDIESVLAHKALVSQQNTPRLHDFLRQNKSQRTLYVFPPQLKKELVENLAEDFDISPEEIYKAQRFGKGNAFQPPRKPRSELRFILPDISKSQVQLSREFLERIVPFDLIYDLSEDFRSGRIVNVSSVLRALENRFDIPELYAETLGISRPAPVPGIDLLRSTVLSQSQNHQIRAALGIQNASAVIAGPDFIFRYGGLPVLDKLDMPFVIIANRSELREQVEQYNRLVRIPAGKSKIQTAETVEKGHALLHQILDRSGVAPQTSTSIYGVLGTLDGWMATLLREMGDPFNVMTEGEFRRSVALSQLQALVDSFLKGRLVTRYA
ncbi:MAG: hypothetical protein HYZ83_03975 [Candidatus Omnitrophica bacterium]|nr:hypothetical protein [Candidatus Omnitrophota bacterium]